MTWRRGKLRSDPAKYKTTNAGSMIVNPSRLWPGKWRWDAHQRCRGVIIPSTHYRSGLEETEAEAQTAAETALAEMIRTNGKEPR